MSMHGGFIMVQGNHLASLPEVFSRFKYITTSPPRLIGGWKGTLNALEYPAKGKPKTIAYKAACLFKNWTVIYDPEMLMVKVRLIVGGEFDKIFLVHSLFHGENFLLKEQIPYQF